MLEDTRGGYASHFSELVQAKGKVICFEPHQERFGELKAVAESCPLKNIQPYCLAISESVGTAGLYFSEESRFDGASTICPELAIPERLGPGIRQLVVKTTTLDSFCQEANILPDFVKIDVEGAENKVITGGVNTIRQARPVMLFECGISNEIPNHFAVLRDLGYVLWVADITHFRGESPSWDDIVDSSNKKLCGKIYSFTDDELLSVKPALINVLGVHQDHMKERIPGRLVMPLGLAFKQLRPPCLPLKARIIKHLPGRLVQGLRNIKKSCWHH